MKTKVQKLTACLLTITMLFTFLPTFSLPAFAEGTEEFVITATDGVTSLTKGKNGDYEYTSGTLTVHTTTPTTISMKESVTTTSHIIVVNSKDNEIKVTFNNISIDTAKDNAIELDGNNQTEFNFIGTNTLKSKTKGIAIESTPLKIMSDANGTLVISGANNGIGNGSKPGKPLEIGGNVKIKISDATTGIYNNTSSITVSGTPEIDIDVVENAFSGIGLEFIGGIIKIKNDNKYAIVGTGGGSHPYKDIEIKGTADIHILEAKYGINSNDANIIITGNAKLKMYGGDENNKIVCGENVFVAKSEKKVTVSDNAQVDLFIKNNAFYVDNLEIKDKANVNIKIAYDGKYTAYAFNGKNVDIKDNATLDIQNITTDKKMRGFNNSSGTVNISNNANVNVYGTSDYAFRTKYLNISDNATLNIENSSGYALYKDVVVKPAANKTYMVKTGATSETTDTKYYAEETTIKRKSSWKYFNASVVDSKPVHIVSEDKEIVFGGSAYDISQMFHIDTNAGDVKYSIVADGTTGEGTLDGSELTVTKVGEIKIKVETAQNGIYLPGSATATLTVLPKQISTDIDLAAPVKYEAPQTSIETDEYTATVAWSPEVMDKFATRTEYTATITITPKDNYTVEGIVENSYTVDGVTSVSNEANGNVVTVVFPKTAGSSGSVTATYTVKFDTNGGSTIKNQTVTEYQKAKEPTTPTKDGHTFAGWYSDKELTKAYDFSAKVTKSMTLYAKWIVNDEENANDNKEQESNPTTSEWQNPFTDVKADDWYYNAVKYAYQNGLMGGMTTTTFAPNTPLTRGMLVTILYRMEGSPTVTGDMPFADVNSDAYYHNAILWAVQNNVVSGISATEFAPDVNITREQLAAILQRYAQYKGYDTTQGGMQIREYSDYEDISGYALNSMTWAVNSGLLKGKGENMIAPQDTATRAEVAAILQRFIENNK